LACGIIEHSEKGDEKRGKYGGRRRKTKVWKGSRKFEENLTEGR